MFEIAASGVMFICLVFGLAVVQRRAGRKIRQVVKETRRTEQRMEDTRLRLVRGQG